MATLRDPLALRPFVIAITLNTVKYERRRRRRRARVALMPDPAQLNVPGRDQPASNLAFDRFTRLIRKLAEREQATFVYRFIEGMTVAQIARALNISEPTARRSFSRAWVRMQKWAARDPFLNDYLYGKRRNLLDDEALQEDETDCSASEDTSVVAASGYSPSLDRAVRFVTPAVSARATELARPATSYGL